MVITDRRSSVAVLFAVLGLIVVRRRVLPHLRIWVSDSEFTGAMLQSLICSTVGLWVFFFGAGFSFATQVITAELVIHPSVALRKPELFEVADTAVASCHAYVMAQGRMAFVYVTDPARKAEFLPRLKERFTSMVGVDRVIDGEEASSLGMRPPAENPGVGELVLLVKAGYAFQRNFEGSRRDGLDDLPRPS